MPARLPPPPLRVPRVLDGDDFAPRRRHHYAAILDDAGTGERTDVLPDRGADTLARWLREHPGVEIVCRDGSGTHSEAARRALPDAVRAGDRRHRVHDLLGKGVGPLERARRLSPAPVHEDRVVLGERGELRLLVTDRRHGLPGSLGTEQGLRSASRSAVAAARRCRTCGDVNRLPICTRTPVRRSRFLAGRSTRQGAARTRTWTG
ncbi:transposase [Streptomyces sp. JNUCC 63]